MINEIHDDGDDGSVVAVADRQTEAHNGIVHHSDNELRLGYRSEEVVDNRQQRGAADNIQQVRDMKVLDKRYQEVVCIDWYMDRNSLYFSY
jgi:hypothetical protein